MSLSFAVFIKPKKQNLPTNTPSTFTKSIRGFYTVSNGADLFKDQEYGQWGLKLYSIEEVIFASKFIKVIVIMTLFKVT